MATDKTQVQPSGRSSSAEQPRRVIPVSFRVAGTGLNVVSLLANEWASGILASLWFTVFKTPQKPWMTEFWASADERTEVTVDDAVIPVYSWGKGPLVVTMHGWSGSGTQFQNFLPALVQAGYRVVCFDAPAHGCNPGRRTHLVNFSDSLAAIQARFGLIDTLIAHSLGAMATVYALQASLVANRLILVAPHLDVQKMFETYRDMLRMRPALAQRFHDKIGERMQEILGDRDPWEILNPQALLGNSNLQGMLVYDHQDPEVSASQFEQISQCWKGSKIITTEGLGHNRILKDASVISAICDYLRSGG